MPFLDVAVEFIGRAQGGIDVAEAIRAILIRPVLGGVFVELQEHISALCPTLRDQLAIQWSFQMGFGHEVWEVTAALSRCSED